MIAPVATLLVVLAGWAPTVGGGSVSAPGTGAPPIDRFAGITTTGFS
jgi:hypothetical protein